LPYETKDSFINGICELLELGQHSQIEVWFTDLLSNSELASPLDRFNYGLQTIKTTNYLALLDQGQDELYPEEVELVCATNTMTTDEMIDSYVYAWMIVNFHLQGYTQLTSRLCRQQYDISFRQFYDALLLSISTDEKANTVYLKMKNSIANLLRYGKLDRGQSGHNLLFNRADEIFQIKSNVFDLVAKVFADLTGQYNTKLDQAQRLMVVDIDTVYPVKRHLDFDISTFEPAQKLYEIRQKSEVIDQQSFTEQFYALRRKGLLKTAVDSLDK
jgi:predicted nucleic acid-binding protein